MKITAFGASYSKVSINRAFAAYAAAQFPGARVELLDLNLFQLPLFTTDRESENGIPEGARRFLEKLEDADLLIISMAEHNGSYTAAFKNLFDWTSRLKGKMFEGKKILLLSASTGQRGGAGALEAAVKRFPRHGGEILASFSLPLFEENFDPEKGIRDEALAKAFREAIRKVKEKMETGE